MSILGIDLGTGSVKAAVVDDGVVLAKAGQAYAVDHPAIVPMQTVATHFTAGDQRGFRRFAVDQALRVRRVEPEGAGVRFTDADRGEGARGPAIDATRSMGARHVA